MGSSLAARLAVGLPPAQPGGWPLERPVAVHSRRRGAVHASDLCRLSLSISSVPIHPMPEEGFMKTAVRVVTLGMLISACFAGSAAAQYIKITTDNPTDNTRMRATGTT